MHGFAVVGMVVAAMVVVAALLGHEDPVLHLFRVELLAYNICVIFDLLLGCYSKIQNLDLVKT